MSSNADDWTNEFFLDYCSIHSETERALFHTDHLRRLLSLAGAEEEFEPFRGNWMSAHADVVKPLVARARERMKEGP